MGYRHYVSASSINLSDEPVDLITRTTVQSVKSGMPFRQNLLNVYVNGITNSANQAYNYAASGKYPLGLPNGTVDIISDADKTVEIQAIISGLRGEPVTVESHYIDTCDPERLALQYIDENYTKDPDTGSIEGIPDQPHFLSHYFFEADFLDTRNFWVPDEATEDLVIFYKYGNKKEDPETYTDTISEEVSITDIQPGAAYHHVTYYLDSDPANTLYWNYPVNNPLYPELAVPADQLVQSPFLPIIPVRLNNKAMNHKSLWDTELYKESKILAKIMDLNFDDICTKVEEFEESSSIDHAFLIWGVDLGTEVEYSNRYLHEYFTDLANQRITKTTWDAWNNNRIGSPPVNRIRVNDSKYKATIDYNYIHTEIKSGKVTDVGKVTKHLSKNTPISFNLVSRSTSSATFRKQLSEELYEETIVSGLVHHHDIYYGVKDSTTIDDVIDNEDKNFTIPLSKVIMESIPLQDQSHVYYDAMRLVSYSHVAVKKKKKKWYQKGWFKAVLAVIAVILAVIGLWQLSVALIEAGLTIAALEILAMAAIKALLVKALVVFAVNLLPPEFAAVLAVVALIYAYNQAGSDTGGLFDFQSPTAEELLLASSGLMDGATESIKLEFKELMSEMEVFEEYREEQLKELREAQDLLDDGSVDVTDILLNTSFMTPVFVPHESPDDLYNRTIHSGNIGTTSLQAPSNYVSNKLELPKIDLTILEEDV